MIDRKAKAAYDTAHREEINANARKRYAANPEKGNAYRVAYRAAHREEINARSIAYDAAHLEERKTYRAAYQASHREERNARQRKRYAEDPAYRLSVRLRNRLNDAIKGKFKAGSAVSLLGCSIDELLRHFDGLFTDGMTWANHGEWHIDHIRPLSSFDLEDQAQLAVACHYSNLQPLWATENLRKWTNEQIK